LSASSAAWPDCGRRTEVNLLCPLHARAREGEPADASFRAPSRAKGEGGGRLHVQPMQPKRPPLLTGWHCVPDPPVQTTFRPARVLQHAAQHAAMQIHCTFHYSLCCCCCCCCLLLLLLLHATLMALYSRAPRMDIYRQTSTLSGAF
jgi:hypothetical protein